MQLMHSQLNIKNNQFLILEILVPAVSIQQSYFILVKVVLYLLKIREHINNYSIIIILDIKEKKIFKV